jgi:hypothetical protein
VDKSIEPGFPIINRRDFKLQTVPWGFVSTHEKRILDNHCGQSLKKLAKRGGLSYYELVAAAVDRGLNNSEIKFLNSARNADECADRLAELVALWRRVIGNTVERVFDPST